MTMKATAGRAGEWRGCAAALLLLLGALLVIFRGDLGTGSDLFFKAFRDINPLMAWYPWSRLELTSWSQGLFPLWNPYNLLGHPLLADYQSAVFSVLLWPLVFGPLEPLVVPYLLARVLVAGLGAYLLGRRTGMGRTGAAAAALGFGLTGYLMQYVNNEHLVIDLLIPYLLLAGDQAAAERKTGGFVLLVLVSALVLVGGQPGSALFTLALGYGYALFRCATAPGARLGRVLPIAAAGALAAAVALIQLLPFLEFIPQAWNFHTGAFGAEHLPLRGMVAALAAGFYGPLSVANQHLPLIRIMPYLGTVVCVLAGAGLLRPTRAPDGFFAGVLVLTAGILCGLPGFDLLGRAPGLRQLTMIKYLQPLAAFAAVMLAARMVDELLAGRGRHRVLICALAAAFIVLLAGWRLGPRYAPLGNYMNGAAILAIILAAALALIALTARPRTARLAGPALIALLLLDLIAASVVNRPFRFENMARRDMSAIRELTRGEGRSIAAEDVLIPNQNLLVPEADLGVADALIIRGSFDLFSLATGRTPGQLEQDFLRYHSLFAAVDTKPTVWDDLLAIGPRISRVPLPFNRTIGRIFSEGRLTTVTPAYSVETKAAINDDWRQALFAHAPCRWDYENRDEDFPYRAELVAALDQRTWDRAGDGVWFMVQSAAADGAPAGAGGDHLEWSRYLDARRMAADRAWIPVESGSIRGPRLSLITLPASSSENDWALWGDLRLGRDTMLAYARNKGEDKGAGRLADLPDRGKRAGEYRGYFSPGPARRLTPQANYRVAASYPEALALLEREVSNPNPGLPEVVILPEALPALPPAGIAGDKFDYQLVNPRIGLQTVATRIKVNRPCLLIDSDAFYPGWRAYVNGIETRIYRADLGLRAVEIPAGESQVELVYQPWSFRLGLWAGVVGVAAWTLMILAGRVARERRN
jgi:hypothetical protein